MSLFEEKELRENLRHLWCCKGCVCVCTHSRALSTTRDMGSNRENLTLWWGRCLRNSGCHFHPSLAHFSRVLVAWEALYTIGQWRAHSSFRKLSHFSSPLSFPPAFVSVSSLSPHCEKIYKKGSIFKGGEGLKRGRFHREGTRTELMAASIGY